ncbi:voltage-gated chloride channel family protein (plasmid) [Clostridium botulinum]|uniref:Voltage-gated chloride channel protein n=1 Tax=Clostridium botulinum C/D str. DC5 TaxID=1443128 RepID=A0A0A0HWF2_CLOBO|nr:voltage-gated chloride channel family protein [Clostridium botulinum]KGM92902.1 voltage-gated chloride channel protein [Clostridium botulinum C/D str. DC5]KOC52067.1 voltage-gated chloride channel protein [Clostridium botulinum]KOC54635.1 voltage-gated chloride channel protein [Clostridium botulinum]MCD3235402.1 voltage-gated chloride channel family protein [Clostridium botulinum D/C]MCD3241326.1 voltage-gated chloride channel family protein [Clostridium botulinum D/C]
MTYNNKKENTILGLSFLKWGIIGSCIGIIIGIVIALFLLCLENVTKFRTNNPYILFLLPIGGVLVSFLYYKYGGNSSKGNNLIIEKINKSCENVPLRMVPLVFFGTVVTHFFGGSAGREGTGLQIGASIGENIGKLLKLNKHENRIILMAGVSGGFSAIFGTPLAGTIFGLEVSVLGKMSYEALIPCLAASIVGNSIVSLLGIKHSHYIIKGVPNLSIIIALKIIIASILFGLTSMLFSELTHKLKAMFSKHFKNAMIKSFIGGIFVVILTFIIGTYRYLGLSLPLMEDAFNGNVHPLDFLGKLIFTSVTLGSGYQGGEVTPLFVVGSTLGSALSQLLNLSPSFLASLGLISVFTGATNTPIASFILGIEMFGSESAIYMLMSCSISYIFSGHTGIYTSPNIGVNKNTCSIFDNNTTLLNYRQFNKNKYKKKDSTT